MDVACCRKTSVISLTLLVISLMISLGSPGNSEEVKSLIKDIKEVIQSVPVEERARFIEAASYYNKGAEDFQKGLDQLDPALMKKGAEEMRKSTEICPSFTPAHFKMITFFMVLEDAENLKSIIIPEGEKVYQELVAGSMDVLKQIIQINQDNVSVATCYILRSYYYLGQNDYKKAMEEIQSAIKAHPHYSGAYQVLAKIYQAMGKKDKAKIASLRESAEENYKKKKYKDAVSKFKDLVKLEPRDAAVHSGLGMAYYKTGNKIDAKKEFYKAISLDPSFAEPYTKVAYLLDKEGNTDQAIEYLRKSIKINPNDFEARVKVISLLNNNKKFQDVLVEFREAAGLRPLLANSPAILFLVANAFNHFNDYDGVISVNDKILKLSFLQPELIEKNKKDKVFLGVIYFKSATAYGKKKEYRKAIEALKRAINLRPDWIDPWIFLGITYQHLEDNEKAVEAYKKAVVLSPNGKHADFLRKLIKRIESQK